MEILIEKVNTMGLVKSKRSVKLPKGKLIITIGEKKFLINNTDKLIVDQIENE